MNNSPYEIDDGAECQHEKGICINACTNEENLLKDLEWQMTFIHDIEFDFANFRETLAELEKLYIAQNKGMKG